MPDFQHYAVWDEALGMVRNVNEEHGFRLIPDQTTLKTPHIKVFDRYVPEVGKLLRDFPVLYLEGPFTKHPLHFEQHESGEDAGTYYVDRFVGPRLRWLLPGVVSKGPKPRVTPGSISYSGTYLNPTTDNFEPASDELKAAFKGVVGTLKAGMVRVAIRKGRTVWVGRETERLLGTT